MMLSKKRIAVGIFLGIVCVVWGYLVYDVNNRFPEPEEYVTNIKEDVDYYGITAKLEDVSYYEIQDLLVMFPKLEDKLKKVYGEDMSENYNYTYIIAEFHLSNESSGMVDLNQKGKAVQLMSLELGPYSNGVDYFIYSSINQGFDNVLERGEQVDIYLPLSIHKLYMDMDEMKSYDVKLCYQFYPEKRYFYYKPEEEI